MRAIEVSLRLLAARNLKYVFGIPAGSVNALYDALIDLPEIKPIVVKHENSAGYMACSYTRISGHISLCTGSSGPGATNLVTPAANAWKEKLPVLFLTGSVPFNKIGKGGAQELSAAEIFSPITKLSRLVTDPLDLPAAVLEAYETAMGGVPGPVHLAVPIDVQMAEIDVKRWLPQMETKPLHSVYSELYMPEVIDAANVIRKAGPRGAILAGYGAKSSRDSVIAFAEKLNWPVATTPRGKGLMPETHRLSLGVYGLSGHDRAMNYLHGDSHDVLLVLGSSLGELATNNWEQRLVDGKKLIHVDWDAREFEKMFKTEVCVEGVIETVLQEWSRLIPASHQVTSFNETAVGIADEEVERVRQIDGESWNTRTAIRQIGRAAPANTRFYLDIGEFMTYSIQNLQIGEDQDFDININFGGMGSGIGGALGAQLAEPERPVICITGDGCFYMHGFELLAAKEYDLPIVFIVINNARLGMVYHGHKLQYKRCLEDFSQTRINISEIGASFGLQHIQISDSGQLTQDLLTDVMASRKPTIIEVVVDGNEIPPMGARVKFLQGATY